MVEFTKFDCRNLVKRRIFGPHNCIGMSDLCQFEVIKYSRRTDFLRTDFESLKETYDYKLIHMDE